MVGLTGFAPVQGIACYHCRWFNPMLLVDVELALLLTIMFIFYLFILLIGVEIVSVFFSFLYGETIEKTKFKVNREV